MPRRRGRLLGRVLFVPTLVSTVYGMTLDHMPELGWAFGYPSRLC